MSVKNMKTRIITGISASLFAITCLVGIGFGYAKYLSIVIAVLSAVAVHEVASVSKCKTKPIVVLAMIFAAAYSPFLAFGLAQYIVIPTSVIMTVYVIAMLLLMLKFYDTTRFEHVALVLFISIAVPASLNTLVLLPALCDANPNIFQRSQAVFMLLCAMYCAWLSDTFAYFIGSKFGKHKLSPKISPKKSVEGAVAGVVGTTITAILTYFICDYFFFALDTIKLWHVILVTAVTCVLGMFGDLSASVIKRNFGEKDFGTIFPGHGGVIDRIDSFLFTMPTLYLIVEVVTAFANR